MSEYPSSSGGPPRALTPLLLVLMGFPALLFLWIFCREFKDAQTQYHVNQTYEPVPATIISSRVQQYKGSKGAVYYKPLISYQYNVQSKDYFAERVFPINTSGSAGWAESVVRQFPVNASCTAWYDPRDPDQAVLVKRFSFTPYSQMLAMSVIVLAFCFGPFFLVSVQRRSPPGESDHGWFEIKTALGLRQRLRMAKLCTLVCYGLMAVPVAHYLIFGPAPHSEHMTPLMIAAAAGLIPVLFLIRYLWLSLNFEEARMLIERPAAARGQPLKFVLSQNIPRQTQINFARVRLRCVRTTGNGKSKSTKTLYEATVQELKDQSLHPGQPLEINGQLTPPADQPPSGPDPGRPSAKISWSVRFECLVPHAPKYSVAFPLTVLDAPVEMPKPERGS